jgi:hypothetical protein
MLASPATGQQRAIDDSGTHDACERRALGTVPLSLLTEPAPSGRARPRLGM